MVIIQKEILSIGEGRSIRLNKLFLIPFILFSLISSLPAWSETWDDLVEREGLYYEKFSPVSSPYPLIAFSDSRMSQERPIGCSEWYVSLGVNCGCEVMAFGVSHPQVISTKK